jgi:hypothetical protein
MLGIAVMYLISLGISYSLQRFFTPSAFIAGDIAKHIVPLPRVSSATTKFVSKGFSPRSAHSTEAKKDFISTQK